ncbi:MAG: glycosyltransferase [Verrucomicrobiota bacterium]
MTELAEPVALNDDQKASLKVLAEREEYREWYRKEHDPLPDARLRWRAQSFRHLTHLIPGESVLEIGLGDGTFRRRLEEITHHENPVTSIAFGGKSDQTNFPQGTVFSAEQLYQLEEEGRKFNHIVANDLLDYRNCGDFLMRVINLLHPGGQAILYVTNPWNPFLRLRRALGFARDDHRQLLSRPQLYELMSEIGFIRIFAVFNDFVYGWLARFSPFLMKNASVLAENVPSLRWFAGAIIVHGQKPGSSVRDPIQLTDHDELEKKISYVIPCHNEEMNVIPLVKAIRSHYDRYIHEIVLVDDNSKDRTREVIEKLAAEDPRITPVIRTPPPGVGNALRDGYAAATGEYIHSLDCDFQHLLPEFRDMYDAAVKQDADVVVGSRFSRMSILLNYPWLKIVANRGFHVLFNLLFWKRFRDLTNNLKLSKRKVLQSIEIKSSGFSANAETGLLPILHGFKVIEVPISWINRTPSMGASSFRLASVGMGYAEVLGLLFVQRFTKHEDFAHPDEPKSGERKEGGGT